MPFRLASIAQPLFALTVAIAVIATPAGASPPTHEPFFPRAGNKGYNALDYDVSFSYGAGTGTLHGRTVMSARARQGLTRFSLDFRGLSVKSVWVDGERAAFSRGRDKLIVALRHPVKRGAEFSVRVGYEGRPRRVIDPDGTSEGWNRTDDGALAVGEPQGTMAWIPCNNVPADKASFTIRVNVPSRLRVVSNGVLQGIQRHGARRSYIWREAAPMSTYLALLDIGRGKLVHNHLAGLPAWTLIDPRLAQRSRPVLGWLPEIIRWESHIFGPYPFAAAGSVVDLAPLGYALETQSRPIYAYVPDRTTVVHETAHQWFGDSVGLERWPNIWLNEGFATWTQWYFAERHGGPSAQQVFARLYRKPASQTRLWEPPSGHPGQAKNLFVPSTYVRGAMALQALRDKIGIHDLLRILRTWATEHRHGHGDIEGFIALSSRISHRHLGSFFHRWLFERGKP
jgi:aminopeptidase N